MAPSSPLPRGSFARCTSPTSTLNAPRPAEISIDCMELWKSVDWSAVQSFFKRLSMAIASIFVHAQLFSTQKVVAYALATVSVFPEFANLFAVAMSGLVFFTMSLLMVVVGTLAFILLAISGFATSGVRSGSLASSVQSIHYRSSIPRGSTFSVMQSIGARGGFIAVQLPGQASMHVSFVLSGIIRWIAGSAAVCLFLDDILRSPGITSE